MGRPKKLNTSTNAEPLEEEKYLPIWQIMWLGISALICVWDATFIFLRPGSLPGGKYHWLYQPYAIYVSVDKRYKDMSDTFVYVVSCFLVPPRMSFTSAKLSSNDNIMALNYHIKCFTLFVIHSENFLRMNCVEIVLSFLAIFLSLRRSQSSIPLAFTVSVMTWWKTVLYMLQYLDCMGGGEYHAQNDAFTNFLYLWLPNGIWICLPMLIMASLWSRITPHTKKVKYN